MLDIINYMKAGYAFFYVRSDEIQRTMGQIVDRIKEYKDIPIKLWDFEKEPDPESAIRGLDEAEIGSVVIAKNFNWFIKDDYGSYDKTLCTLLSNRSEVWQSKDYRKTFIIVSNEGFDSAIPMVLTKQFVPIEAELPTENEVGQSLKQIIEWAKQANPEKFVEPDENKRKEIISSALGMTESEVKNAMALSLVRGSGNMDPADIFSMKAKDVAKTAGVKIGNYSLTFESLKGYDNVKQFAKLGAKHPLAKGIMLLGPPGVGKSHFCKCLGNEVGLPVLVAEMAELFGGIVGETEKLVRSFIAVVSALAPCILFVDEIEKGLAGIKGGSDGTSSTGDSVAKRAMSQFLKFLSDERPPGVYVVATCNDISSLPPEWIRAGRWDCAPFFIDLPNDEEKEAIYKYYVAEYQKKTGNKFKSDLTVSEMKGWSGAEIESCCRIAGMYELSTKGASKFIIPVSKTMDKEVDYLRKWAENRTIPATTKVYNGMKKTERSIEL